MKKIILCVLLFSVPSILVFSQELDLISAAPPSKTETIAKGRNLLMDAFLNNELEKTDQLFLYLENEVANRDYAAFTSFEKLILSCYLQHYDIALATILYVDSIGQLSPNDRPILVTPTDEQLEAKLVEKYFGYRVFINAEINISDLQPEEKELLILALDDIFLRIEVQGDSKALETLQDELNKRSNNFITTYPDSKYNHYVVDAVRYELAPSKWGYGMYVLMGYETRMGDLSNFFGSGFSADFGISIYYKKFTFNLQGSPSFGKLKEDIIFSDNVVWQKNSKMDRERFDVSIGYNVIENNWLGITPFAGAGLVRFIPTTEDEEDFPELKDKKISSFAYVMGVDCDLLFKRLYQYGVGYPIRLRMSYGIPTQFSPEMQGNTFSVTLGVEFRVRPLLRKK